MQISKKSINKSIEREVYRLLYQLVVDIKSIEEAELILSNLLEKSGLVAISKRLAIAHYLDRNRSYKNIKDTLKVSSATISTVDKQRRFKGYHLALRKIEAERWASEWSDKITGLFKK